MKLGKFILLVSLLGAMVACADSPDSPDSKPDADKKDELANTPPDRGGKKKAEPTLFCPQVAIVRELETYRDYGNEDPHQDHVLSEGRMLSIDGGCTYDLNGVDIKFSLDFAATRGRELKNETVKYPYFIALVDPQDHVIEKKAMTLAVKLSGAEPEQTSVSLHVYLPLTKETRLQGALYRVLTGFQLDEAQLKAIRGTQKP